MPHEPDITLTCVQYHLCLRKLEPATDECNGGPYGVYGLKQPRAKVGCPFGIGSLALSIMRVKRVSS
jgi:hypothetical protein